MDDLKQDLRVKEWQHCRCTRGVPPVPHELQSNGEEGQNLDTSIAHAVISFAGCLHVKCTGGVAVGEDAVTFLSQREGKECGTDLTE